MKQERDSLATTLNEIRHDTSRKMADMQQRFDHVYALMQDCQVWPKMLSLFACCYTLDRYAKAQEHHVSVDYAE